MCAEKDPLTCHRAILVCRHLRQFDLAIAHIGPDAQLESHECLEIRLLKTLRVNGKDLINSQHEAIEHAYDLQSDRIAYTRNAPSEESE